MLVEWVSSHLYQCTALLVYCLNLKSVFITLLAFWYNMPQTIQNSGWECSEQALQMDSLNHFWDLCNLIWWLDFGLHLNKVVAATRYDPPLDIVSPKVKKNQLSFHFSRVLWWLHSSVEMFIQLPLPGTTAVHPDAWLCQRIELYCWRETSPCSSRTSSPVRKLDQDQGGQKQPCNHPLENQRRQRGWRRERRRGKRKRGGLNLILPTYVIN